MGPRIDDPGLVHRTPGVIIYWPVRQARQIGAETQMRVIPRHLRLSLIAFLAIVGLSSTVGAANAAPAGRAVRECCLKRVCTVCCCKPSGSSTLPRQAEKRLALPPVERSFSTSGLPCECRSNDPATPVSSPNSRTVEERGEEQVSAAVSMGAEPFPSGISARLVRPSASPPHTPLYVRNARLL